MKGNIIGQPEHWYNRIERRSFANLIIASTLALNLSSTVVAAPNAISTGTPSLDVIGNRVLAPDGETFSAEGISIYGGLEDPDYMANIPNVDAQIEAAAEYWHANTIRLQVAESNLFKDPTPGKSYNVGFLDELTREVSLARGLNQAVVINDQTEFTNNTPNPTAMTEKFWQVMATTFGNQPDIIFDLFNEPRLDTLKANTPRQTDVTVPELMAVGHQTATPAGTHHRHTAAQSVWDIWKNGGEVQGTNYVGMQTLVDQIRAEGVNNLVWVESPYWGQRLPAPQYLLSGSNIVYSYHHIDMNRPASWRVIENFASRHAVVDGEWAQYQSPWEECYSHAPTTSPMYLNLLRKNNIGLIAWSLQAGSLLKGAPYIIPSNTNSPTDPTSAAMLRTPSEFSKDYACNNRYGHGVGQLLMHYFGQNSKPL